MKHYLLLAVQPYSIAILRPIQEAILARGDDVQWFLYEVDPALLNPDEKLLTTVKSVQQYNPMAVFVPGNWAPDFFPGVKVEVFHGFGIEKRGHFKIRGLFDLYCTHGPATTEPFIASQKKHGYFSVIETGWSKMDSLFTYKNKDTKQKTKPVILYAPTFSPSLTSAPDLLNEIKRLSKSQNWSWIIKFHPKMPAEIVEQYRSIENENLYIVNDSDIIPVLHEADIMLSDTSSVVAEFLCLDKPVITYKSKQPGPHTDNILEAHKLEASIKSAIEKPDKLMTGAREFVSQMHPYNDGKSSDRILDAVDQFIERDDKLKPKPLNLWRKWQMRKRLGYYHLK